MDENASDWRKNSEKREKLVKKMARLLEDGHRMLDQICPKCGTIIFFRKDIGLKYCPNCDIFLATPEEIAKIGESRVKIIGEFVGGRVIETKEGVKEKYAPKPRARVGIRERVQGIEFREDISAEIDDLLKIIIQKIKERIDYEFDRLSLIDAFKVLGLILKLKLKISEDNETG